MEKHFTNKKLAEDLFNHLCHEIESKIGPCQIISIPCCVHLFGKYDFLAALPKKDRLEVRFAYDQPIDNPRINQCVSMSARVFKICLDVYEQKDVDQELITWLEKSYYLKGD